MTAIAARIQASGKSHESVYFTECDHLMLQRNFGGQLERILLDSGCDMLGYRCADRSNTNDHHYLVERDSERLLSTLRSITVRSGPPVIWGALQCSWLFRWKALDALTSAPINGCAYTEIAIPTAVYHLGFQPGDFHDFGTAYEKVRYRPVYDAEEVLACVQSGALCVHPFKDTTALASIYKAALSEGE